MLQVSVSLSILWLNLLPKVGTAAANAKSSEMQKMRAIATPCNHENGCCKAKYHVNTPPHGRLAHPLGALQLRPTSTYALARLPPDHVGQPTPGRPPKSTPGRLLTALSSGSRGRGPHRYRKRRSAKGRAEKLIYSRRREIVYGPDLPLLVHTEPW